MRVLRVAQKAYPDVTGGGAYHVHALSRDQAAMGHDVTVLTVGDGKARDRRAGYDLVRIPARTSILGNAIAPGVWRRLRRPDDYDVVHAHSHLYFSTVLAALARRLGETPLAVTNHGLYSQSAPRRVFGAYLRTVGRFTFDSADRVFCYTATDRERLRELGVTSSVNIVPNGVDTDQFSPKGPTSNYCTPDRPTVLFAGRLVAGKRPTDVVRAAARLSAEGVDLELLVVGDGPRRDALEGIVDDEGIEDVVSFAGHLPYDEMPAVYREADVLALPSRAEGLSRTVLEALATATPVVTSDLPQLRELVARAGRTVPQGDVAALAAALESLLTDPDLRSELGGRGREFVETNHAWKTTVDRTTGALAELVADS